MTIFLNTLWKKMENYKGQWENFMGSVGLQGAAKQMTEIMDVFELFFCRELTDMIVKETNRYTEQFLCERELSIRLPDRAWKSVTGRNLSCILSVSADGHYSETYSQVVFYHK
jgi:hypothetical protein